METYVHKKINKYCSEFRSNIIGELDNITSILENNDEATTEEITSLLNELRMKCAFISVPEVNKDDFKRKKRTHHTVPESELCNALCLGGVRCSRRKQPNSDYCGTHSKGQSSGTITKNETGSSEENNKETNDTQDETASVINVYPYNENGIIKLYSDNGRKTLINANDVMKCRM